tara:strand:- start:251 stop:775 length:525 start_codon:yes stop_codon:yes gene_type:complete
MNKDLVTYQTYESPKKTGGVIVGVSLLTVGLAILILYLVKESRKSEGWGCTFPDASNYDPVASKDDGSCKFTNKSQAKATTVEGLLDELFAFGSPPKTDVQQGKKGCTDSVGCNYDQAADIDDGSCDYSCDDANDLQSLGEIQSTINGTDISTPTTIPLEELTHFERIQQAQGF